MAGEVRPYQPRPWPWGQPSILVTIAEEERRQANYWLDADLDNDSDDSDSDYVPSEGSDISTDSAEQISESELSYIRADAQKGWRSSSTQSLDELEKQQNLDRQIGNLLKAEEDAAAAYDPDEAVSLITQFYELLVTMGHWPEGSIRYPPHTNPPVNEDLALQLGYTPAAISVMLRLPYVSIDNPWHDRKYEICSDSRLVDYTADDLLKEARRPYPYKYFDGCPDLDPWMLPILLAGRYGRHVMLDTNLGVIRAYGDYVSEETVEWRRHGEVLDTDEGREQASWTEYRRAPLVPAARYFSELIHAYHSLSRLPVIEAEYSDPLEDLSRDYCPEETQEKQQALLTLYRECGWPHEWRRAEFLAKWIAQEKEIEQKWWAIRESKSGSH
ncbi:hypothetical protein K438DRAFT_1755000 [Mycena galopus ATCC 62051]|nr:hypothetical protein K438DRAFT_1755000 [Mycena galopus ATCC 62051]